MYRKSPCKPEPIVRLSYLYNGVPCSCTRGLLVNRDPVFYLWLSKFLVKEGKLSYLLHPLSTVKIIRSPVNFGLKMGSSSWKIPNHRNPNICIFLQERDGAVHVKSFVMKNNDMAMLHKKYGSLRRQGIDSHDIDHMYFSRNIPVSTLDRLLGYTTYTGRWRGFAVLLYSNWYEIFVV